jgi:hypothetical protein
MNHLVEWRDLVDRLAVHDIHYLNGGSEEESTPSSYTQASDVPVASLVVDLARAPQARLRDALIALLLRHPDYATTAEAAAEDLAAADPIRQLVLVSIVVAAALQREWGFSLDLYLQDRIRIQADHLRMKLDLPPPNEDFGRPCLYAAAGLLLDGSEFPFAFVRGWRDVVHRLPAQLIREAR